MAQRPILEGVVVSFDAAVGVGSVRADDGSEHPFHCTAITDGTRTIEERTRVCYTVRPGVAGRFEATRVHPRR